jgi:polyphosphate kinase
MDTPRETAAERRRYLDRRRRPAPARALRVLPPREIDPSDLKNPALYINRELSWLEFNERVLAQARAQSHPLLERVKFLAITATNLDEFFMIRVSTMLKNLREGIENVAPDGYNTEQQLEAMRTRAHRMLADLPACWLELRSLLEAERITLLEPQAWTPELREHLAAHFSREICPLLTPLAFDPGHPFPFISNLSKNFAVVGGCGGRDTAAHG